MMGNNLPTSPYDRFGGILSDDKCKAYGLDLYRQNFKNSVSKEHGRVLHDRVFHGGAGFEFVDNLNFNAVAFLDKGMEFIGINTGLVRTLRIFSKAILADKNVFKDFGKISDVVWAGEIGPKLNSPHLLNTVDENTLDIGDESREVLAEHLALMACVQVLHHEMAHLSKCHIPYLSGRSVTMGQIEEIDQMALTDTEARTRRILELDADKFGNSFSYSVCENFAKLPDVPEINEQNFMELWGASMHLLYSLMSLYSRKHRRDDNATHPDPSVRLANAMIQASTTEFGPDGAADWSRVVQGTEEIQHWWIRQQLPTDFLKDNWEEAVESAYLLHNQLVETQYEFEELHRARLNLFE